MGALCQRSPLSSRAPSCCPASLPPALGDKRGTAPILGHSFSRTWDRSTRWLWNEADLLSLVDTQLALFPLTGGRVLFWFEPSSYSMGRNKRPSCYGALAKESANRNISLKINAPQSSGRKRSLIAAAPSWHGHGTPRDALESYQTQWGSIPIVPTPEDFGANCKLKHHQRGILIEDSLTSVVICKAMLDFRIQKNFHCSTKESPSRTAGPSLAATDIQIDALQNEDIGNERAPAILAPESSLRPGIGKEDGVECPEEGRGLEMKGASVTHLTLSVDVPWILCKSCTEVTHSCFCPTPRSGGGRLCLVWIPFTKRFFSPK